MGWTEVLLVAAGGAVGGVLRYWLSGQVDGRTDATFPWGTLVVNVSGAFLLGFLGGQAWAPGMAEVGGGPWLFLGVGALGSYTTVSSFSLQTLELVRSGETGRAWANVVGSFVFCLAAAAVGLLAAAALGAGTPPGGEAGSAALILLAPLQFDVPGG